MINIHNTLITYASDMYKNFNILQPKNGGLGINMFEEKIVLTKIIEK